MTTAVETDHLVPRQLTGADVDLVELDSDPAVMQSGEVQFEASRGG